MPKTPPNSDKRWTNAEESQLHQEIKGNTPTRVIGLKHVHTCPPHWSRARRTCR